MSLSGLREEVARHGPVAYLLTVGGDGRPHTVQLAVSWSDDDELVLAPGNSTVANAAARPLVSLLWPPAEAGGYSLIVDGTVSAASAAGGGANSVSVTPTKAVLHRPGASGSDCVAVYKRA